MSVLNWRPVHRRLSSRHGKFAADLCLFWHGVLEGKKQPVAFYSRPARAALENEVQEAVWRYLHQSGEQGAEAAAAEKAERLGRLWELFQTFIVAQNEAVEFGPNPGQKAPRLPDNTLPDFLHLLYGGERADDYWRGFMRRHRLRPVPLSSFWDYFEEFQARRMELASWLAASANGKILDLGSGAQSYVLVDTAADISRAALKQNKNAKKKIVIKPLDEMTAKSWPFSKGSFDTIMLNSVLSYVKNHARLFRLIRSSLRPGGVLLITNAPILPHHPASFFIENEVTSKKLASDLKKSGFEFENHSRGQILLFKSRPRSTRRHKPKR